MIESLIESLFQPLPPDEVEARKPKPEYKIGDVVMARPAKRLDGTRRSSFFCGVFGLTGEHAFGPLRITEVEYDSFTTSFVYNVTTLDGQVKGFLWDIEIVGLHDRAAD